MYTGVPRLESNRVSRIFVDRRCRQIAQPINPTTAKMTGQSGAEGVGLIGGLPPAIRAAHLPIAAALREL